MTNLPLRYKLVLPFIALLIFVGSVGTMVVTARVTDATVASFDGGLLRASLLANDHLALLEADRVAQLRTAIDTIGVAEAIAGQDIDALTRLLVPIQANALPAQLTVRVLNGQGQELLYLPTSGGVPIRRSLGASFAAQGGVQDVLNGRQDAHGDKVVFLAPPAPDLVLYWAGPVRGDQRPVVGAILLGESLVEVAERMRSARASEVVFYNAAGFPLTASLTGTNPLSREIRQRVAQDQPVRALEAFNRQPYALLVSDWRMRGSQLGYLAVALKTDGLQSSVAQVRLILSLLFILAALLTMLVGVALASHITRPLELLVTAMHAVSAGNLQRRAPRGPNDEIGYLAATFNDMTARLEQNQHALEQSYFATMEALARAIDARDPYTLGHSSRVAALSLEIADAMNLPPGERESLRRGALLHDVGKIGVDDRLLRKAGPLNAQELDALRRHPVIGYDMLAGLRFLRESLPGVRHHHERWDGNGYPDGLLGEAIPLAVRIISVADVFDALTSDRPYARGMSLEEATRHIVAQARIQFDPAVVAAFQSRAEAIARLLKKMGKAPAPHPADIGWLQEVG